MNKLSRTLLCASLTFYLSGCGNGGDASDQLAVPNSSSFSSTASSNSSQIKPSYFSVNVDLFLLRNRPRELTDANFAVITIDLAGKVLEKKTIDKLSIQQSDFSNAQISLTATPSVNTLLVVDIEKPFNLSVGSTIKNKALLYTPLTNHNISLSLFTTAAYNSYLTELGGQGTFTEAKVNVTDTKQLQQLQYLIKNANDYIHDTDYLGYGLIEDQLLAINTQIGALVKQSLYNSAHSTQGSVVDLVSNGGMYLYSADQDALNFQEMTYSILKGKEPSKSLTYNNQKNLFEPTINEENEYMIYSLGKSGWVDTQGTQQVYNYNNDNSVTISPSGAPGFDIVHAPIQAADISGLNIKTFLELTHSTHGLSQVVDSTKIFPADSKIYLIGASIPNKNYMLYNATKLATVADALSADTTPNTPGFILTSFISNSTSVQLIDDSAKTAKFYITLPFKSPSLEATGSWKNIMLPYIANATDKSAIEFEATKIIATEDQYSQFESIIGYQFFLAPFRGKVYSGLILEPTLEPEILNAFNSVAHTAIQGALVGKTNTPISKSIRSSTPLMPLSLQKVTHTKGDL